MKIEEMMMLDKCMNNYISNLNWFNGQITRDGALLLIETPRKEQDFSLTNQNWTITLIKDSTVNKIELKNVSITPTEADIFSDGTILLVQGRCSTDGDTLEQNACRYDATGQLKDSFLLGDGISQVQIDEMDTIWVSYFDEGIFGAFENMEPIGAKGLVAYSKNGQKVWEANDYDIADCYAMNVVSSKEVNFYYYDSYKLVQLKDYIETASYMVEGEDPVDQFIFDQEDLLVQVDSYNMKRYKKSNQTITSSAIVTLIDEKGKRISGPIFMRVKLLYAFGKDRLYKKEY